MQSHWMYAIYPLVSVVVWAGNTIIGKLAVGVISPNAIGFYRLALMLVLMTPFCWRGVWEIRHTLRRCWWQVGFLGVIGLALYPILSYYAAQTTSAMNMGMIISLLPVMTYVCSSLILKERMTPRAICCTVVSLVGVLILLTKGNPLAIVNQPLVIGDLLMLVAISLYALYGICIRKWQLPVPVWTMLYLQIVAAAVMMVPAWLSEPLVMPVADSIPLILYAGLLATFVAQYAWIKGVGHLGASRAAFFMNLFPLVGSILAMLVLDEQLHGYHVVGGSIVLLGVIAAQLRSRQS